MSKQTEALKLALEALRDYRRSDDDRVSVAMGILQEALAEQPAQHQKPVAWHDKIKGMEVSMDVSTGEDDAHNRIYGRVYEVILEDGEGTPNAILAIEEDRNFTSPQPAQQPTNCRHCGGASNVICAGQCKEQPANQLDDINVVDIPKIGCVNHDCDKCKAQQQKPDYWIGLTEQERNDLEDYCEMIIGKAAFEAIEAKLREKNA